MTKRSMRWTEGQLADYQRRRASTQPPPPAPERPPSVRRMTLELPAPPSVNEMYYNRDDGSRGLTTAASKWKSGAQLIARRAAADQGWYYEGKGRVRLRLVFHFANEQRDISNGVKITEDAVASALGFNDRRVGRIFILRGESRPEYPHCKVTLTHEQY